MSINFATLQGLTIPEGVVTQIADASGRVLWALQSGEPIVLKVEKITSSTYAGETTYTAEEFILLDIYPKTNGTVKVTYGGLTKTITDTSGAEEPNAQKVFFGTFNGVSDSVTTPASGTLTIEGDYVVFGVGSYEIYVKSASTKYCNCITEIITWGSVLHIPDYAFSGCTNLTLTELPNSIHSIGAYAFSGCTGITLTSLPNSIHSIGAYAFEDIGGLALTELPSGIVSIGNFVFYGNTNIVLTELPSGLQSIGAYAFSGCTGITLTTLPTGLRDIGNRAFEDTTVGSIDPLIIPEGVLTIGIGAFVHAKAKNITLPSTITSIGGQAFYAGGYSSGFGRVVTMMATVPPTLTTNGVSNANVYNTFDTVAAVDKIIVPVGCGSAYRNEETWIASGFAEKVVEAS